MKPPLRVVVTFRTGATLEFSGVEDVQLIEGHWHIKKSNEEAFVAAEMVAAVGVEGSE